VVDELTEENYLERGLPIKGASQLNILFKGPSSRPPIGGLASTELNSTPPTQRAESARRLNGYDGSDEEAVPHTRKRVSIIMPADSANSLRNQLLELAPKPRLCHLVKRQGESFGFSLRTYEDTKEKVITRVDIGSPAKRTGLKEGDFVIEIDGINVTKDSHRMITSRLAAADKEIKVLVVGKEDMNWYKANGVAPKAPQEKSQNGMRSSGGHDNRAFERENVSPTANSHPVSSAIHSEEYALQFQNATVPELRDYVNRQVNGTRESPEI